MRRENVIFFLVKGKRSIQQSCFKPLNSSALAFEMESSRSQNSWACDLIDLCRSINETVEEKKDYINKQECFVVKLLADYIQRYVNQWIDILHGEEIWWNLSTGVGKELHTVLDRGLQLISLCGQKSSPDIAFVILGWKGELGEIIDDARIYAQMINRSILLFLNSLQKETSAVKKLMFQLELDCLSLQSTLETAYQEDKNTLLNSSDFQPYAAVSSLLKKLEPNISDTDLSLQKKLGQGSFGKVRKAEWQTLPVAVKTFECVEYFKDELKIYEKLLHADSPHIVRMLGYSANNKLVLELMDEDLKSQITGKSLLPLAESLDLILQIAKAMRHLHSIDVVHRDLKPANVLITRRKDKSLLIKLTDFGISKESFETASNNTDMRGTFLYMAPEMVDGARDYSRKVDVFSFGLISLEILKGKVRQSRNEKPILSKDIPKKLGSLISDCTESDDGKRPSFDDICESLWLVKEELLTKVTEAMELKLTIHGLRGIRIESIPRVCVTGKKIIHVIKQTDIRNGLLRDYPADTLFDLLLEGNHHTAHVMASGELKKDSKDLDIFAEQFQKWVKDQGRKYNLYLSIGAHEGNFSDALSTATTRATLVNSIVKLLESYPIFNGFVFHHFRTIFDFDDLVLTLEALREKLPVGRITIALVVRADIPWEINLEKAIHLLDQVHVLPYQDRTNRTITAHVSALYPSPSSKQLSIDEAVKRFKNRVPSSKLFIKSELVSMEYADTEGIGMPGSGEWGSCYKDIAPESEKWDDEAKASADLSYNHERSAIKALHYHLTYC